MSSHDDHRWPVRAANTATGAARTWRHLPRAARFGWVMCMCLYTFIPMMAGYPVEIFIMWEVFFGLVWAAAWASLAIAFMGS